MVKKIFIFFLLFTAGYWLRVADNELCAQDKIVAIVNKDIITQKDLSDFVNFMRVQLSTEYNGKELESKIQSMKLDLLDKLIEDRLILQEAEKTGIRINPGRIKAKIDEIKRHYSSDTEFQISLAKQGLVQADLEKRITEQMLMYSVIEIKIRSKIIIKPAEVTRFYQDNIRQFVLPEQRELESVTVDSKGLCDKVYESLTSGEDFKEAAKKHSLTVSKIKCARDGRLRADLEEALFKMEEGEVSSPIKIDSSYYVFKLNNIIPPRQQTLPEVQNDIQALLFNNRMQEALTQWLDELKSRSYIEILQK